jgi:hypothetical protein
LLGRDYGKLKETSHWLSDPQIRAAPSFYALYPDQIDQRIARNAAMTQDKVLEQFPFPADPED